MTAQDIERLRPFAARYLWWKTAEEALRYPERVVAQVMNIGSFEDLQRLDQIVGEEGLRLVSATRRRDSSLRAHGTTGIIV